MKKLKLPFLRRFIKRGTCRTVLLLGPIAIKSPPYLRFILWIFRSAWLRFVRHKDQDHAMGFVYTPFQSMLQGLIANLCEAYVSNRCPRLWARHDAFRIARTFFSLFGLLNFQRRIHGTYPGEEEIMNALRQVAPKWAERPGLLLQHLGGHCVGKGNWIKSRHDGVLYLIDYGDSPGNTHMQISYMVQCANYNSGLAKDDPNAVDD